MTFPLEVNGSPLYNDDQGGEAWLFFEDSGQVCIVTDIHGEGSPHNAVRMSPEILRRIASMAEQRQKKEP